MIRGIILAAGTARRMGKIKQLLPLGNQPMLCHIAHAACQSELNEVVLVTGAAADLVASAVDNFSLQIINNPDWSQGQASSLKAGLRLLTLDAEAVLFLLADQPLITAGLINRIIEAYRSSGKTIICPAHGERRGNPVLFDLNRWRDALSALSGDQGARQIIVDHPDEVGLVAVESEEIFWDIDTEEDYRRIRDLIEKNNPASL
jgi:molybdenum cofactor cytidylyltransferase